MKPLIPVILVLVASCAPQAIVLRGPQTNPSPPTATSAATPATSTPQREEPEFGILEPHTLAELPDERDMRPTVDTDDDPAVIATPPTQDR